MTAFTYAFKFADGRELKLDLRFDAHMRLEQRAEEAWTSLEFHRCSNCPLPSDAGHCPFAAGLAPFLGGFDGLDSFARVQVMVRSAQRVVVAERAVQHGLASLIGLIGATSGCPRLEFFRPMARFHLPFASEEETVFRVLSSHLVEHQLNGDGPPDLQQLKDRYRAIEQVNMHIAKRLLESCDNDAAINAIVHLDIFAKAIPFAVDQMLEELRPLYPASGASGVSGASV